MNYYDKNVPFGSDRDRTFEQRKHNAALYITAHKELLQQAEFRTAYNKILDEYAREFAYIALQKPIADVSDQERESESAMLEFEAVNLGKEKIERYKDDAAYVVDWVKSGKSLIIYRN